MMLKKIYTLVSIGKKKKILQVDAPMIGLPHGELTTCISCVCVIHTHSGFCLCACISVGGGGVN